MKTKRMMLSTRRPKCRLLKSLLIGSLAGVLFLPTILLQTVSGSQSATGVAKEGQNGVNRQRPAVETPLKRGNRALVDRQIRSINGEVIGKIENVVVDSTGRVKYAVASIEGWWGLGSKEAMVPIDKLNITRHRDYVYFEGTEEEMEMYPNYSDYGWTERRYGSTANTWFNRRENRADARPTTNPGPVEKSLGDKSLLQEDRRVFGSRGIRASQLIDKEVRNRKGEILGKVDDVVIRPQGDVRLVVFIGQALDMKDKKVQADLQDIAVKDDDYLVYDVSTEELQKDPNYSSD